MNNNVSVVSKEKCCGCHACFNICPQNAIKMISDSEGFLYPYILNDICINCGKCLMCCPGVRTLNLNNLDIAHACFAKDDREHMSSSSGGFFAVIAKKIIQDGGFVCGAAFDETVTVNHILTNKIKELEKIKKTKYVQSRIGNVYTMVEQKLNNNKTVLFSGTPCQVAGLKLYLGKDYENLICIDLICHGVPSPKVFSRYLSEKGGEHKVISMSFRNKNSKNRTRTLNYVLDTGEVVTETYDESPYIKGFIQNLYIRPSCFHCRYKGIKRCSDITIGDFLGINEFYPGFSNSKGTSAVILHTKKGVQMFNNVKDRLNYIDSLSSEIAAWNSCLCKSIEINPKRKQFFEIWQYKTITDSINLLQKNVKKKKRLFEKICNYFKLIKSN